VADVPAFRWADHGAVLFDLDGVITPTAEVHERAWAELFADFDYTPTDYLRHIDGKPRYDGVAAFLASRGQSLPWGTPNDPPGADTVCGMGNAKNDVFAAILAAEPMAPYPGTIATMDLLDGLGRPQAIVSSSRNARMVLESAGLLDRFNVIVDGMVAAERGLPGKPDPATFIYAAALLGVDVSTTVVVEDAVSGVAAGVAGGFGFVLGVDRGNNASPLREAGAHLVVEDLAETLD